MKNITKCEDGVYRWVYELNLYRNPTVLFLLWKIFGGIGVGIWAMVSLFSCGDNIKWEDFLENTKFFAVFILGMLAFVAVGYLLYALVMGGKYCVLFEMDEEGVRHTQIPSQFKKAQIISAITAAVGAAAGKPGTVGAGLLSGSNNTMYSGFSVVRRVKAHPRRHVIKVNELLMHNQVYADGEDFDFVLNYILERVPETAKKK